MNWNPGPGRVTRRCLRGLRGGWHLPPRTFEGLLKGPLQLSHRDAISIGSGRTRRHTEALLTQPGHRLLGPQVDTIEDVLAERILVTR